MRVTLTLTAALLAALAVKIAATPIDRFDGLSLLVAALAVAVIARGSALADRQGASRDSF